MWVAEFIFKKSCDLWPIVLEKLEKIIVRKNILLTCSWTQFIIEDLFQVSEANIRVAEAKELCQALFKRISGKLLAPPWANILHMGVRFQYKVQKIPASFHIGNWDWNKFVNLTSRRIREQRKAWEISRQRWCQSYKLNESFPSQESLNYFILYKGWYKTFSQNPKTVIIWSHSKY